MKLYYWKGDTPNFGDELNLWLMPKVLPGILDADDTHILLAIGSVLFDSHPAMARKTVLGSGWGGYTDAPKLDATWDVRCVRGPLTARALGLSDSYVAGDTAILLRNHYAVDPAKRVKASFVPHFESIARGQWQAACKLAGVRFIDPTLPVETVLKMLCESEVVITEAMHGAIVSDALRVPWIAMEPYDPQHHMKWGDWAAALDLEIRFQTAPPSSAGEAYLRRYGRESWHLRHKSGWRPIAAKPVDIVSIFRAAAALAKIAKVEPQLSSEAAISVATDKLQTAATELLREYTPSETAI